MQTIKKASVTQPYQFNLGTFKIFALLDGYVDLHLQNIIKDPSAFDHPYLHAKSADDTIQIPVNVYLVDIGTQLILVDVGLAGHDNSQTGFLMQQLKLAGYKPEQIADILITHLHPDHVAGLLTKDGKKAFPNAKLYISKEDVAYWIYEQKIYLELAPFIAKLIAPYDLHTFVPNQKLFEGVTVFSTPGHSPGHSGFLFESEPSSSSSDLIRGSNHQNLSNQKILILGDIVHIHELQFTCPGTSLKDDTDQQQAIATRKSLFEHVSKESILIGGAHLPYPGLGYVEKISDDNSYCWKSI